jgi:hypothetical protein
MNAHNLTIFLVTTLVSSPFTQKQMRAEVIPARSGTSAITIMVPNEWKVISRKEGNLQLENSEDREALFTILKRKDPEQETAFQSSVEVLIDFRKRVPETTKEWKSGSSNYAVRWWSSRTTRTQRPNTFMSFTVWNREYAVTGDMQVPKVIDLHEAQDWELIARSIKLK